MDRSFLPFYFPTNAVLLDDDPGFLRHFSLLLDPRLPCRTYSSVAKALQTINSQNSMISRFSEFTNVTLLDDVEERVFVDLKKLHALLYDSDRFSHISVVIIDYDMPEMNGIEVCKRIRNPEIKKILLTGKADEKIAVEAFNAGLIDQYIRKSNTEADLQINNAIKKLQMEYFMDITKPVQIVLADSTGLFLSDAKFNSTFSQLLTNNKYIEFYLWEQPKGILMLDARADQGFLFVMPKEVLKTHYEIAKSCDAPAELLPLLNDGTHLAWFPTNDGYYTKDCRSDWRKYIFPVNTARDSEKFLCAFVNPAPLPILNSAPIQSFNRYLENFDTEYASVK